MIKEAVIITGLSILILGGAGVKPVEHERCSEIVKERITTIGLYFTIDDIKYNYPYKLSEFLDNGWSLLSQDEGVVLEPEETYTTYLFKDREYLYVEVSGINSTSADIKDSRVIGITLGKSGNWELANGTVSGMHITDMDSILRGVPIATVDSRIKAAIAPYIVYYFDRGVLNYVTLDLRGVIK